MRLIQKSRRMEDKREHKRKQSVSEAQLFAVRVLCCEADGMDAYLIIHAIEAH